MADENFPKVEESKPKILVETEDYIDFEWNPTTSIKELSKNQISQYCFDPSFEPIPYSNAENVLKFKFNCIDSCDSSSDAAATSVATTQEAETLTTTTMKMMAIYADGILMELWKDDIRIWMQKKIDSMI